VSSKRKDRRVGRLSQERIDELNTIGFVWDPVEDDYQRGLGYLKAYKAEHGHCRVPALFKTEDGFKLGYWVSNRRRDIPAGRLTQDRIDTLNEVGFVWKLR